ncbi:hypothetical protein WISP_150477 [Willisornis vidua]|uniref:Uncharacterized protein n=1 Tax=Willisornis vidua TaxID=1566151 RepID=A0ABQ9CP75_9PASS|nr:hypothetical protein WISP_150477 [Willisornis vidua]
MEVHGEAKIHLQPMDDLLWEVCEASIPHRKPELGQASGRTCGPMKREAHGGAGLLARLGTPWGDPSWHSLLLKDYTPQKGPTLLQFMKNCRPWESPTGEKFMEDCFLWMEPHTVAGEEREEEGAAEAKCDEVTATPIPSPPMPLTGRR